VRRCRDCKYWVTRKGCVHPAELARIHGRAKVHAGAIVHARAIVMDKYSVYRHTNCDGFVENKEYVERRIL
jgi:hypothetical protein